MPSILPFKNKSPVVPRTVFLATGSKVIGDVVLGEHSSIWYGAIIRGDVAPIRVGENTNIQDGAVVHVSHDRPQGTSIGMNVTVGHLALIHACTIGDECMIGMHSCLMDGVVVEKHAWVAAGALVTPGKRIRSGELWAGAPAKPLREVRLEEIELILASAANYVRNAVEHSK